jgi:CheY-like chemotaxis protein|mmetsp:Transcript_64678/g.107194  ORF Transcript_64678/g.107194 Transcript_64678/m.107194 type:complete len:127 (-) Transcript_64678:325-705(-)
MLYISPQPVNHAIMKAVFLSVGLEHVHLVSSMEAGLALFHDQAGIEVVIMDHPKARECLEFASVLRQEAWGRRVCILSLTVSLDGALLEIMSNYPPDTVDGWVLKPFSKQRILAPLLHFFSLAGDS